MLALICARWSEVQRVWSAPTNQLYVWRNTPMPRNLGGSGAACHRDSASFSTSRRGADLRRRLGQHVGHRHIRPGHIELTDSRTRRRPCPRVGWPGRRDRAPMPSCPRCLRGSHDNAMVDNLGHPGSGYDQGDAVRPVWSGGATTGGASA